MSIDFLSSNLFTVQEFIFKCIYWFLWNIFYSYIVRIHIVLDGCYIFPIFRSYCFWNIWLRWRCDRSHFSFMSFRFWPSTDQPCCDFKRKQTVVSSERLDTLFKKGNNHRFLGRWFRNFLSYRVWSNSIQYKW